MLTLRKAPLHLAAKYGFVDIVEILLDAGCDPNVNALVLLTLCLCNELMISQGLSGGDAAISDSF